MMMKIFVVNTLKKKNIFLKMAVRDYGIIKRWEINLSNCIFPSIGKRNLLNVDLVREVTTLPCTTNEKINEKKENSAGYSIKTFGSICFLTAISLSILLNYYDLIF